MGKKYIIYHSICIKFINIFFKVYHEIMEKINKRTYHNQSSKKRIMLPLFLSLFQVQVQIYHILMKNRLIL